MLDILKPIVGALSQAEWPVQARGAPPIFWSSI